MSVVIPEKTFFEFHTRMIKFYDSPEYSDNFLNTLKTLLERTCWIYFKDFHNKFKDYTLTMIMRIICVQLCVMIRTVLMVVITVTFTHCMTNFNVVIVICHIQKSFRCFLKNL